ncbi:MAG: division/cell wall cluster transcriptional repressor MraZ [Proteobacteria bacterium]|nr:division/cell wall cluster transcriptional repressor MraZ [Pseudomonadota bacterium]
MFRGVNNVKLDAKGRMAIPTRYRDRLQERCGGELVVTVDRDHCLLLYPLPDWEEIERKLVKLPSFNAQARRLQRLLVGHATELEMDSHGRVLLPSPLRDFAGLDKSAVMIGQGNKFEIWDEDSWNERRDGWLADDENDNAPLPAELESLSL